MTKTKFTKQMLKEWNDVVLQFKNSPKQSMLLLVLGFVFALLVTGPIHSNQLAASVTDLGSVSAYEGVRKPKNQCATPEIILACQLGTKKCPSQCKTNGYGYGSTTTGPVVTPKPDCTKAETVLACALGTSQCPTECKTNGYGYGSTATGPVVTPKPDCTKAEIVLACALGTSQCPAECQAPQKPRVVFPPKRR